MAMNILNLLADYLEPISKVLLGALSIFGTYLTVKIYKYAKRAETNQKLAQQIIAYNCLEQELVEALSKETGESPQTIKIKMRQKVLHNTDSETDIDMFMKPSTAKNYLK